MTDILEQIIREVMEEVDRKLDEQQVVAEVEKRSDLRGIIDQIRQKIPMIDWLQEIGAQVDRRGRDWIIYCPFHDDGHNPNGRVNDEYPHHYRCFSSQCEVKGDIIDLYQQHHGVSWREAVEKLAEKARVDLPGDLFRLVEKDKLLYNSETIARLNGTTLSQLLSESRDLYEDMLGSSIRYCMDPSVELEGDDPAFFYSMKKYQERRGGDLKVHRRRLYTLLSLGLVHLCSKDLARKAGAKKALQQKQGARRTNYAQYFTVPRLTDDLLTQAEAKADILLPIRKRLTAAIRDQLLACGDDLDQYRQVVDSVLQAQNATSTRMGSDLQAIMTRYPEGIEQKALHEELRSCGHTRDDLDQYLPSAIRAAGLRTLIVP